MRICPYCAEEIQDEAILCRYCGKNLSTFHNRQKLLQLTISFIETPFFIILPMVAIAPVLNILKIEIEDSYKKFLFVIGMFLLLIFIQNPLVNWLKKKLKSN